MPKKTSYRESTFWKQSITLATQCYQLSSYPASEEHPLTSQLFNAALAIPVCIAEGLSYSTKNDTQHFISRVRRSLIELETLLVLSNKLRLAPTSAIKEIVISLNELNKRLDIIHRKTSSASQRTAPQRKHPPSQQRIQQARAA